jgi:hypothetical protein
MGSSTLVLAAVCVGAVAATPLDEYVSKPDANYKWFDTNVSFK